MYIWNSNGFAAGGRTLFSCMLVPGICGMPPSGERPLRHSPLRSDIPFFPIGAVLQWTTTRQHDGVNDWPPRETIRLSR